MKNKISNTTDAFFKVKLNKQCNKITSDKTGLQNCKLHTVYAQKGARALIFLVMGLNQALKQTGA